MLWETWKRITCVSASHYKKRRKSWIQFWTRSVSWIYVSTVSDICKVNVLFFLGHWRRCCNFFLEKLDCNHIKVLSNSELPYAPLYPFPTWGILIFWVVPAGCCWCSNAALYAHNRGSNAPIPGTWQSMMDPWWKIPKEIFNELFFKWCRQL